MTPEELRNAYKKKIYVHSAKDVPDGPHLAIIEFGSIYVPGDERSRQAPGHGYPAHSESTTTYIAYRLEDRKYWEADIAEREQRSYRKDYVALDCGQKVVAEPVYHIKKAGQ